MDILAASDVIDELGDILWALGVMLSVTAIVFGPVILGSIDPKSPTAAGFPLMRKEATILAQGQCELFSRTGH